MRENILSSRDTIYALNTTIMKTIYYPLLTTTFTKKECDSIVRPAQETILSILRICKKNPLNLRYRSSSMFGLGMLDSYVD